MLDNSIITDVLTAALETGGGHFAEIFFEHTRRGQIGLVGGICEKSLAGVDFGVGLRIFTGDNAVYTYTNDISREALIALAKNAAAAGGANLTAGGASPSPTTATVTVPNAHAPLIAHTPAQNSEIVAALKAAHKRAIAFNSQVCQSAATYAHATSDIQIANSEGLNITDRRVRSRLALTVIASEGDERQTASVAPGRLAGYEFFSGYDIFSAIDETAHSAVTMLNAGYAKGGKMTVVVDSGFGGVIFHEACGHSLEATSIAKDASVFCTRMGTQIASALVTAVDDGTLPGEYGSMNIDDEGTPARRNVLIENGVLTGYLVDRLNGQKMKAASTGSARRESYRFAPTSRMTNTFITAGNSTLNEIISATEYGIYAKKMGGGSVDPATGEFNFAVSEGYMIRSGRIAEPVRGAALIGKGEEVLRGIDMVGRELLLAPGTCGSSSGWVPTTVGQPPIRVQGLTVGGR